MAVADTFSFYTIQSASEGIFKEKGSKFLSFAWPIDSEADIKLKLEDVKKRYFDASHHCYAWMLGPDKKHFRAFDDGEPNHSAGAPILGQIKSRNLTNVLVVVVRYFGGTKLGVGGLAQAYKTAAEQALTNAKILEVELTVGFSLDYDYSASPDVARLVKEFDLEIKNQVYGDRAMIEVDVRLRHKIKFLEKLNLMKAMRANLTYRENVAK